MVIGRIELTAINGIPHEGVVLEFNESINCSNGGDCGTMIRFIYARRRMFGMDGRLTEESVRELKEAIVKGFLEVTENLDKELRAVIVPCELE